jgi:hypothetical protein
MARNEELSAVDVLSANPIVREAKERWKRIAEWESSFRTRFIEDLKFRHGDSDNGFQWPNAIRQARDQDARPCLTMNIIRQHNLQISNDLRKNKASVRFVGTGNGATAESAAVFRDLMRRIEYRSRAQTSAYTIARDFMIDGGIGWTRLITRYADDESMNQEIEIWPVLDPLSVFMDPDCEQHDCSDATHCLVMDSLPKKEWKQAYPKYAHLASTAPLGVGIISDDWVTDDLMRVCEYFRRVPKPDKVVSFVHRGERRTIRKSRLHKSMHDAILSDPLTAVRDVEDSQIEWYLIAGEEIVDSTIWIGKTIPLFRCVGEETRIEGILDRKGHTRAMKDPQRMYNYNASAQVEFAGTQGKTPWTGAVDAIEELEQMWNTANRTNHSYLPFKHLDANGEPIPPQALPRRIEPPNFAPAFQQGMDTAFQQMMMVSGQYANEMGMQGNERTGAAIQKRQNQAATATFHYQDNYEEMLQAIGRAVIDIVPKVYREKQVMSVLGDDGVDYELEIDPTARQAYFAERRHDNEVVKRIFNPLIGRYDVAAKVGPEYGTKREETVEALTLILTQNPGLTGIVGDILLKAMDFDEAQEAARRLKRMVPPQALGQGPTQTEQKQQQIIQSLQIALEKSLQRQGKEQLKLVGKDQMRDIDAYEAETKRMAALKDMLPTDPQGLKELIGQLVEESMKTSLVPILQANAPEIGGAEGEEAKPPPNPNPVAASAPPGGEPPVPGAQRAHDGEWYLADPTRKGRYLHIAPLAQERSRPGVIANG